MKNTILGAAVVFAVGGYFVWSMNAAPVSTTGTTSVPSETLNPNVNPPTSTTGGTPNPPPKKVTTGLKTGTFTGSVSNSVYGPVQVSITVAGGKITAVNVPQYPNSRGHSAEISSMAIPLLQQEVIAAQNAKVDMISGATDTSTSFIESLTSALAQAS